MGITKWSENLTEEIYKEWKKSYSRWKPGVKVFYSPVIENPELMIIGYQPGGNQTHFKIEDEDRFAQGDFGVKQNEFFTSNYRMAKRMKEFFEPDNLNILEKSVIFPLIFFRAPRATTWTAWKSRRTVEELCFSKVQEIIKKLRPKRILVLGLGTYEHMKSFLKIRGEKFIYLKTQAKGKRKVAITAMSDEIKIFAMLHPTGAWISGKHRNGLKNLFFNWF